MKKITVLFIAFLISGLAFGQNDRQSRSQRSPEEGAKMFTERLTKQLTLSADQQEKVYALNLERAQKASQNKERSKDRMKEMQQERKAYEEKLEQILTPDQYKTLKESRAKEMNDRRDQFKRKPGMKKNPDSPRVKSE